MSAQIIQFPIRRVSHDALHQAAFQACMSVRNERTLKNAENSGELKRINDYFRELNKRR